MAPPKYNFFALKNKVLMNFNTVNKMSMNFSKLLEGGKEERKERREEWKEREGGKLKWLN